MVAALRPSVVVASNRALAMVEACVDSLVAQCRDTGSQLIVSRAANAPGGMGTLGTRPNLNLVVAPDGADVPRLRGLGLAEASGDVVLLTEDLCVADDSWISAILGGDAGDAEVVGGRMAIDRRGRSIDLGAFFSEYGFFGGLTQYTEPPLVTGANVFYRGSVVEVVGAWARAGIWENVIHDRLYREGRRFDYRSDAVVYQRMRYQFWAFCLDRFQHGFDYARARLADSDAAHRWVWCAGTPLLPGVLLVRVTRAVGKLYGRSFVRALPWTLAFLTSWSVGEAMGYLRGPVTSSANRKVLA